MVRLQDIADFEFSQSHKWDIEFSEFPAIPSAPESDALNIRCKNVSPMPKPEIVNSEVTIRGHKVKAPANITYSGSITLTFVNTVENTVMNFFDEWIKLYKDIEGKSTTKANITATVKIKKLDNEDNVIRTYIVYNCIPEDVEFGELSEEGGEPVSPTLTMGYDWYEIK